MKKIIFTFIFLLICSDVYSQQVFQLNANGTSYIYWPFPNSQYVDPTHGTNNWGIYGYYHGEGDHFGGDNYAEDWGLPGSADCGLNFYSPLSGTVIFVGQGGETGYGTQVVIRSNVNNLFAFRIAHLSVASVTLGQNISVGQKLGEIGTTGSSTGCHAHCVLYKNITSIYSGSTTGLQRLQSGFGLGFSGGPNTFAAVYLFSAVSQGGFGAVGTGVTVNPSPVVMTQQFTVSFTLQEIHGATITFDTIVVAILDNNNNFKFDVSRRSNITLTANGTYSYIANSIQFGPGTIPGTYKAVARGYKNGWFDFQVTGSGVNPRIFNVVAPTPVIQLSETYPTVYKLSQNFPNPFNPETNIKFDIPKTSYVKLKLYNMRGMEIKTLLIAEFSPGSYKYLFNGSELSSGVYIYKLIAGDFIESKKMILLK